MISIVSSLLAISGLVTSSGAQPSQDKFMFTDHINGQVVVVLVVSACSWH